MSNEFIKYLGAKLSILDNKLPFIETYALLTGLAKDLEGAVNNNLGSYELQSLIKGRLLAYENLTGEASLTNLLKDVPNELSEIKKLINKN